MRKSILKFTTIAILAPISVVSLVMGISEFKSTIPSQIQIEPVEFKPSETIDFDTWKNTQEQLNARVEEEEAKETTIFAAGDVMMSRTVESKMLGYNDFSYCFKEVSELIQSADLAFANLESPIIDGAPVPVASTTFRAPAKSVESLNYAGFDLVSLANNHFGDQGRAGMTSTFDLLTAGGIDYFGAGPSSAEMINPLIKEVNGIKVAFLGYGYGPNQYGASTTAAGMALTNTDQLKKDLEVAKVQADVIIVTFHDGTEYVQNPTTHQQTFARTAVENGADIVIGHHPHVVQTMEIHQGKYIFYSLGNFVFDQMWSEQTQRGLSLMITLDKEGVTDVDYHPIKIKDYCQPNWAEGDTRKEIIDRL